MTNTDHPVQRVTTGAYKLLYQAKPARPFVIRITRGDLIQFREKGRRQWFSEPAEAGFQRAIEREAARARAHATPRILTNRRRRTAA